MLSSQLISGQAVLGPSALNNLTRLGKNKEVTVHSLNASISRLLLANKFTKATVNGNFYWLNLGTAPANPTETLRALKVGLLAAGWAQVSFNIWKNELSLCLWDCPYDGDVSSHCEGKVMTV